MNRKDARERAATRCWATIGSLGGNRSCPFLPQISSCRECEVISVAADDLLARPLQPGRPLLSATPILQASPESTAKHITLVVFEIGNQGLAVDVGRVIEVGAVRPVRRVPHRSGHVFEGLINVLGKLEPCFSLQRALGLEAGDFRGERLVVIGDDAKGDNHRCAFAVDRIALQEIDPTAVGEAPATISASLTTHVRGIVRLDGRVWAWLDVDRLIATLERSLT